MMRTIQIAAILAVSACLARGDFIVAPNDRETQAGNGALNDGFRTPDTEQALYGSRNFSGPVVISGLAFRADEAVVLPSFEAVIPRFTVRLSTYTKSLAAFSLSYDGNKGVDEVVVFDGSLQWSGTNPPGGTPNPFDLAVVFSQPFLYDPTNGHLLMQYSSSGDVNESVSVDIHGHNDPTIGLITVNGGIGGGTIVTRFSIVPVPEATVFSLGCVAIGLLWVFRRPR